MEFDALVSRLQKQCSEIPTLQDITVKDIALMVKSAQNVGSALQSHIFELISEWVEDIELPDAFDDDVEMREDISEPLYDILWEVTLNS